jgi:lipopolysaccharide/colanic/teichoic acid biosynthesis glycosyltransferase
MKSLRVRQKPQSKTQEVLKRTFDILLAGTMLTLSSPLWLAIAIIIMLEDGRPVFFQQKRWGIGGTTFSALKFRSMWKSSEQMRSVQAGHQDPRITKSGRFLRACALDELPQIWNIFRGDMSFVGPRALPVNEIQAATEARDLSDEAIPGFRGRLAVRPGLTGIAQIFADRDIPRARKFRYDILYIRRRDFWLDLRLILLSFYISFLGRWEVRGGKLNKR